MMISMLTIPLSIIIYSAEDTHSRFCGCCFTVNINAASSCGDFFDLVSMWLQCFNPIQKTIQSSKQHKKREMEENLN